MNTAPLSVAVVFTHPPLSGLWRLVMQEQKCVKSVLLKVLKTVRDRIQAELRTG